MKIKKRIVKDLNKSPFPTKLVLPFIQIVQDKVADLAVAEIDAVPGGYNRTVFDGHFIGNFQHCVLRTEHRF